MFRITCRLFQIAYEGDFQYLCTVTFWPKIDFLISKVRYNSRLYGKYLECHYKLVSQKFGNLENTYVVKWRIYKIRRSNTTSKRRWLRLHYTPKLWVEYLGCFEQVQKGINLVIFWNLKLFSKVHIFWEGHKIFAKSPPFLTGTSASQKKVEILQNFCGLLRINELYYFQKLVGVVVFTKDLCKNTATNFWK